MPARGGSKTYNSAMKVAGTKTTADTSLFFAENTIPVSGSTVRELHFSLTPTSDSTICLDNITKVTVKAGGTNIVDASPAQIGTALSYIGKKAEWEFSTPGGTGPASLHQQAFVLPLHMGRGWSAPPGQNLSVILTKNATLGTTSTPNVQIHEGLNTEDVSTGYMTLLSQQYTIGASNSLYSINVSQQGVLMGIVVPTPLNLTLFRFYDASGLVAEFTDPNALIWSQELYQGNSIPTNPSESAEMNPYIFWKCPTERMVTSGITRIDVGTNGSWTDQSWAFLTYFPNPNAGK